MTAPKSFEWRGYVIKWHVDAARGDCWMVFAPGVYNPIGIADIESEAKEMCRQHARKRLAQAQAEFDRVMEGES